MDFHESANTLSWFKDRYLEGSLAIKPSYQRNAVWMARQKCWLVESVLKGMPIPEVFIQTVTKENGDTEYAVVDGQQRIRALLQFVGAETDADQVEFDKFPLDKLDTNSPWYGKAFDELRPEERIAFFRYRLSIRYLESDDEEEIKEMFRRLNKFTAPLKPQELRNATYGGPFAQLALKLADDQGDFLAENRIISAEAIRRMSDVEFVAELMIGTMHGPQGGQASIIDSYYQEYEDFEDEFPKERTVRKYLLKAITMTTALVPDLRTTRWSNKSDFYSLVVAIADALQSGRFDETKVRAAKSRLTDFTADVNRRVEDDEAEVPPGPLDYARNVIRGANDKARRAARHAALLKVLRP
ncbi:MAG TPA: DUF262 domain-containing protein [Pseudolysinimonas sp.]|jgi:hypothetical protein|nr:DUF262 domain-containing protein [Pseudolysinimonas sp.]